MERFVVNFLLNGIENNAKDISKLVKIIGKTNRNIALLSLLLGYEIYANNKENKKLNKKISRLEKEVSSLEEKQLAIATSEVEEDLLD